MSRAVRALAVVAAFSGWAAAWSALPHALYAASGAPLRADMAGTSDVIGRMLAEKFGVALAPIALQMLALGAAAGVLVALWLALLALLDRRGETARALRWSLGGAGLGLIWVAGLSALALVALRWLPGGSTPLAWLAWLTLVAGTLLLPALCWRGDLVRTDALPRAWAPRWPGAAAFALFLAGVALYWALSSALDWIGARSTLTAVAMDLFDLILVAALLAALIPPWLQRARGRAALRSALASLRWPPLRDLLAVQLRIQGGCVLLIGPPLLAAVADTWFLQPQALQLLDNAGIAAPGFLRAWHVLAQTVVLHWVLPLTLAMGWLTALCAARVGGACVGLSCTSWSMRVDSPRIRQRRAASNHLKPHRSNHPARPRRRSRLIAIKSHPRPPSLECAA